MDGLKGLPEAVNAVFPKALTQLCIVHLVRASLRYVSTKDRKSVVAALKRIYPSATAEEAALELDAFEAEWGHKYKAVVRLWRGNRHHRLHPRFSRLLRHHRIRLLASLAPLLQLLDQHTLAAAILANLHVTERSTFQHHPEFVGTRPVCCLFSISRHGNTLFSGLSPPSIKRDRCNSCFLRQLTHRPVLRRHHHAESPTRVAPTNNVPSVTPIHPQLG